MKTRESLSMDPPTTTFTGHRTGIYLSRTTLVVITAIVLCCLCGTAVLFYHFLQCHNNVTPACNVNSEHHHHHNPNDGTSDPHVSTAGEGKNETEVINLFLPKSIVPLAYDLKFTPFLDESNFTFNGVAKIRLKVTENCKNITLHAKALKIDKPSLSIRLASDQAVVDVVNQYYMEEKQFYILETDGDLRKNEIYEVHINFKGILSDDLEGFYRSKYEVGNETRWIATTQFQPTDARKAFPCFDEPALKAKFNISIARPKNLISLSNMPRKTEIAKVEGLPDYVWDIYEESVDMSTYLVAFVVCDFKVLQSGTFGTWAREGSLKSAKYALEIGPQILNYYQKFFQIKYPLPKMDMIAIPDFAAGAMENWGLITYRESAMLYDESSSPMKHKQRVASVVAHELAHQWFGNLVTPSWWSDLWLNEGFANYVEYLGVAAVEPTWNFLDQFVVIELHNVFDLDSLESSHPVSVQVDNPAQINDIFDRISYAKGASIIRMMDHFLTTQVFRNGLFNYLTNKSYSAAEQDDLWHFLTDAGHVAKVLPTNVTVKNIMDTWTLQTGYPVLNVIRSYDDDSVEMKQEKFNLVSFGSKPNPEPMWWIPITYTHGGELIFNQTQAKHWLPKEKSISLTGLGVPPNQWMLVNLQETGYYRVNYDYRNWHLLIDHLMNEKKFKEIVPTNRAQLLDDAMSLANANYLKYEIALNVTRYLKHEVDYVPLAAGIKVLDFLDGMLYNTADYNLFKEYYLNRLNKIYQLVGFEDQPNSDLLKVYTRMDILRVVCHLGHQDCIDKSIAKFHEWFHEANPDLNNKISANIRGTVYCTAIKYGPQAYWDFAWERYKSTNVASEKEILLGSLACTREPWLLTRFMELALMTNSEIRKQDAVSVFRAVASNSVGDLLAFNFIRDNWDRIKNHFSTTFGGMNSVIRGTTKMTTKAGVEELKRLEKEHGKELGRTIKQAIEKAQASVQWLENNYKHIIDWLKANE